MLWNRLPLALSLLLCFTLPAYAQGDVSFIHDVQPILANHCYACHGPDKHSREAELRLDVRESGLARDAIVPGKPDDSELISRILNEDQSHQMPPPELHKPLSDAQKETLRRWVQQGAEYAGHWAFDSIERPSLPKVKRDEWVKNPIDRFILARLEAEGLSPSPEVGAETLIRRATLDLTGLPPTPEQVEAFLRDKGEDRYERLVDRLIASPGYAQRRAQDWLDLARYADTRGFADDTMREIWPYRDWVIHAIDQNMSFDQFTIEQLAGDMLPDATDAQRLASAFHRNAPQAKGVTYPVEEYRVKGVVDRVNVTGRVWLGLTMECAQCHDHKFDPVSQQDYFAMFALFNNIEHTGSGHGQGGPKLRLPNQAQAGKLLNVPVMKEMPVPRETFIHVRGNFLQKGEQVSPAVPGVFQLSDENQPRDRLTFARWLVDGKNPLVARVVVNRYWQRYFGHGLVRTPDDFGVQGDLPSHPELLDWLASEFMDSDWNMKHIHRLIATSATYRQSARILPHHVSADPDNRLLSRMQRVRLPAEQIRDQALAVSDLLVERVGGPSVFPTHPLDYWKQRALPGEWTPSEGESRYRRTMYTYWRRMALHPSLEILNAPARDNCVVQRVTSNVPTQALVLLNGPMFAEAARALAKRVVREVKDDEAKRLDRAFRLVLGRSPDREEQAKFLAYIAHEKEQNDDEQAVWTLVCSVLLNLDEAVTRP